LYNAFGVVARMTIAELVTGIVAILALTACNRNASNPPTAATAATVAPTAAGTPASDAEDEGDIVLVGDADPDSGEVPLRVRFSVDAVLDEELNHDLHLGLRRRQPAVARAQPRAHLRQARRLSRHRAGGEQDR
jgi:hypothetical protein